VIKSLRVEGSVPAEVDDEIWEQAIPSSFFLVPQIIAKDRHFTPSNDTITVRSVFSADEIAILLEWDDRTESLPGDEDAQKIADPEVLYQDMVSIQLPITVPEGMEKPYFVKGDTENPVNLWQWASRTTTESQNTSLVKAAGFGTETELATNSLAASGAYENGTWRVIFKRNLTTESIDDLQIQEGIFIPIAFSAWDGSNGESGTKNTLTTWYWIILESESTALPCIGALIALFLVIGLEMLWLRNSARRRDPAT
jgi:DMSO reductase family type II enzyme heme b subunit